MENTLKQKLPAGAQPIGTFFDTTSVSLMECLGRTGLDFAIIDNEHSPIEAETTAALVRAAELSGICPLARVREIVEQYDFTRDRLVVELTEDSYTHDREAALRTIEGLHAMGLRIALDDMGAGYSSLSDLCTYRFDYVKIDRSILLDAEEERGRALLAGLVQLAHSMGIRALSEGVETKEQLDIALAAGCDFIQGFYFSRVLPKREAERYLRELTEQ